MNYKIKSICIFILMLSFGINIPAIANPINASQARDKAEQFFRSKGRKIIGTAKRTPHRTAAWQSTDAPYYAFDADSGEGFVLITGDDALPTIMGYSFNGSFEYEKLPDNMKSYLEACAKHVEAFQQYSDGPHCINLTHRPAIEPLLNTKWNQGSPFNSQCPSYYGTHCYTGCVPTAMAQIMYYHKWPKDYTVSIPAYRYDVGCSPTLFDWDAMDDFMEAPCTNERSINAVAQLMHYCGNAVGAIYGTSITGAYSWNVPNALTRYFGYDSNIKHIEQWPHNLSEPLYTREQWEYLIYNELENKRPVYMGGFPKTPGGEHAYVCDGFDGNGLFHYNWGWGGVYDGYYLSYVGWEVPMLDPQYNTTQMVIGIQPPQNLDGQNAYPNFYSVLQPSKDGGYITFCTENTGLEGHWVVDFGIAEMFEDGTLSLSEVFDERYEYYIGLVIGESYSIDASKFSTGYHKLVPVFKVSESNDWKYRCGDYGYIEFVKKSDGTIEVLPSYSPNLEISNIELTEFHTVGIQDSLRLSLHNNGSDIKLNTNLSIYKNAVVGERYSGDYEAVCNIELKQNETRTVTLPFMPTQSGEQYICIDTNVGIIEPIFFPITIDPQPADAEFSIEREVIIDDTKEGFDIKYTVTNVGRSFAIFEANPCVNTPNQCNQYNIQCRLETGETRTYVVHSDTKQDGTYSHFFGYKNLASKNSTYWNEVPIFYIIDGQYYEEIPEFAASRYVNRNDNIRTDKRYIIYTRMGGLTVNGSDATRLYCTQENGINQEVDINNSLQQFAIIEESYRYYLYNISTGKFVTITEEGEQCLTESPISQISLSYGYHSWGDPTSLRLNGYYFFLDNDMQPTTVNEWGTGVGDFYIRETGDFDPTPVLERIFTPRLEITNKSENISLGGTKLSYDMQCQTLVSDKRAKIEIKFEVYKDGHLQSSNEEYLEYHFNGDQWKNEYYVSADTGHYTYKLFTKGVIWADDKEYGLSNWTLIDEGDISVIGDVNHDSDINVQDYVGIARYILRGNYDGFNESTADINNDGNINVQDYMKVAKYILYGSFYNSNRREVTQLSTDTDVLSANMDNDVLCISLHNEMPYCMFQLDVALPEGTQVEEVMGTERMRNGHTVEYAQLPDGKWRVLVGATNLATLRNNDGDILRMQLTNLTNGDINIDNARFVTKDEHMSQMEGINLTVGTPTGIPNQCNKARFDVYSLQGVRVKSDSQRAHGVHIVNGKKSINK